jgi:Tfp pilus assembly protein PilO
MKNVISLILIAVGIMIFFMYTNGKFVILKVLDAEENKYDAALEKSKELIALRDALLAKYNAIPTEDLEKINRVIPNSVDSVRLIIEINAIAARHKLTLLDINVGEVQSSAAAGQADVPGRIGPVSSSYGSITLSFGVNTSYETFRAFMADLERNLRLVDIRGITFGEASEGTGLTEYGVSLETYWMK